MVENITNSRLTSDYCRLFIERDLPECPPSPVLMILGHGRSGKDTIAEFFVKNFNYIYNGSSSMVLCKYLWPEDPDHFYNIRHTYKEQLFDFGNLIRDIDPRFIPWSALQGGSQLLVGLRAKLDISAALETCVSRVIWVSCDVPNDITMDYDFEWLRQEASENKVPLFVVNNIKTDGPVGLHYTFKQLQLLESSTLYARPE